MLCSQESRDFSHEWFKFLPFVGLFSGFIESFTMMIQGSGNIQLQIANSHTIFNIAVALIFLPLNNYFVSLLKTIVKEKKPSGVTEEVYIDRLLLDTPAAAIEGSMKEILRAIETNRDMLGAAVESIAGNNLDNRNLVFERERSVSCIHKELTDYMVELSRRGVSQSDSVVIPGIIKCANYLERISDHTITTMKLQEKRFNGGLDFTDEALGELEQLNKELSGMSRLVSENITHFTEEKHSSMKQLDERMDILTAKFSEAHVKRLEDGKCTIEESLVYLDMITNLERIANYLYKISRLCRYELQGISFV
jgi:phosphate:Na+ symporter